MLCTLLDSHQLFEKVDYFCDTVHFKVIQSRLSRGHMAVWVCLERTAHLSWPFIRVCWEFPRIVFTPWPQFKAAWLCVSEFVHVYMCECVKVVRSERSPCSLEFITLARFHSRLILWLGTYTIMSVYVRLTYKNYAFTINWKFKLWLLLHMVVDWVVLPKLCFKLWVLCKIALEILFCWLLVVVWVDLVDQ